MIEYIKGDIVDAGPAFTVVEAHGVGFGVNISLNTYTAIQGKPTARLWIYEAIRDDAYTLFGFATRQERDMFLMLISVSGVGPNTARVILSNMTVAELCDVIASGNEKTLRTVKGIGQRTAQRIIVDLHDRVTSVGNSSAAGSTGTPSAIDAATKTVRDEAISALTMLGFSPAPTTKVVNAILKSQPTMTVEQVVKQALRQIK